MKTFRDLTSTGGGDASAPKPTGRRSMKVVALLAAGSTLIAACGSSTKSSSSATTASSGSGGSSTTATASTAPIHVGEILPMTGKEAFVGKWFDHGVQAGIYAVNNGGGVLGGRKFTAKLEDTAGDPVDAVTALKTDLLYHPKVMFGPSSLEIEGVIRQFGSLPLVDFMEGGTTQLDYMNYPYVFRVFPSDSELLAGEAYYGYHVKNCTSAGLVYTSGSNAQAEVSPVTKAYTAQGGKIAASVTLVADQSSYSSEVAKLFNAHPQCVFFHMDPQTASTFFANVRQLNDMNIPFITGDTGAATQMANAIGLQYASKWVTGMGAPPAYAQAQTAYTAAYNAVWKTTTSLPAAPAMYDAVVIAALAMDAAKSTNPSVYVKQVTKVAGGPGTACYTYPSCLALLNAGTAINYQGVSGNENFNQYHNVFSSFEVQQFSASGTLNNVYTEKASVLASLYNKG